MELQVVTKGERTIIEGVPAVRLLHSPEDVIAVMETCFEHRTRMVLLYAENLPGRFFDLSSGEAGAVLQKLRNYSIKMAVVLPPGGKSPSERFQEMLAEESQGEDFRVFDNKAAAEAWLK